MLPAHYSLNSTRVQENYAKERRAFTVLYKAGEVRYNRSQQKGRPARWGRRFVWLGCLTPPDVMGRCVWVRFCFPLVSV